MNKKLMTAVIALAILVAGGFGFWRAFNNTNILEPPAQVINTAVSSGLVVSEGGKTVSYNGVAGQTALATLRRLTTAKTTSSSYGEYITSINGLSADSTKEFWAFYVNNKLASVGASSYTAVAGDKIEWKLESM